MHGTNDRKLAFWRRIAEQYERSGLSRRAFCERKGIKKSSLDYWRRRVGEVQPAFVEVKVAERPVPQAVLQVLVGEKYRIQVHGAFDSELFTHVVRTLESLA
jgi:transposase-like protein